VKVTYLGHSCFQIQLKNIKILFDPFISGNKLASQINVNNISVDYILVSHGHFDHIADVVAIAKQSNAVVISSFEITEWLKKQGIEKVHPMNTGGKWQFEFGAVKCVAAVHSNSLPDSSYGGAAMGFIIENEEKNFYYAGDTALTYDMKLIGEYRKVEFAFLPIGDNFTMSIDNAIIASDFIKCNNIVGMHYDTFPYITIDKTQAVQKFENAGKKLTLFDINQTIEF
jgi:L-ascorbate metabolism protein UlaG (beta-lactamase superfamily)